MAITDEEKLVVVLIEATGRSIEGVQVWGPFETHDATTKWIQENATLHLDLYGKCPGRRLFHVTRFVSPMFP